MMDDEAPVPGETEPVFASMWSGVELGTGVNCFLQTRFGEAQQWGFPRLRAGIQLIGAEVLALDYRLPNATGPTLARVHDSCSSSERLASVHCDCADQLEMAHARLAAAHGVLVLDQGHEGRGMGLIQKIRAYKLQWDDGLDTYAADARLGVYDDGRCYEHVAAALQQMSVGRIRLLTSNPHKVKRLRQAGVQIAEVEWFAVPPRSPRAARYLDRKLLHGLEQS